MQRTLLKLLRILRFVRDYIVGRVARRWSLFTAFLVRRMSELRLGCSWNCRPGTSQHPRALLPGNRTSSFSASGGYVVAASTVPASFQEDAGQSASVPQSPTPSIPASLSVHQPRPPYGRNRTASSSGNLSSSSSQSRASERLSTIVNSTELLHAPVGQPSRPRSPRGIYRQFGPDVDPSTSRGQLARSHSPSYHQNITHSDSHLPITTAWVPHPHGADEGHSPIPFPSPSFSMHGQLRRSMWSGSSTSINLSVQGPSTDSLHTTLTEESIAMSPAHPTPPYSAMDQSETASQHSTIASSTTSEFVLPEGRFLQMIHSDQIPRYDNVTM